MADNMKDGYGVTAGAASPEAAKMAMIVYALYAVNLALPGPFGVIGVVLAYLNRDAARGTWLESHYIWEIRSFWISLAWVFIGIITAILIVGWFILALLWVWWAIRIAVGWSALAKERPIPNPRTWFF